ncbi:MAG: hypothetical protein RSB77_06245 [Bacilli bacterium]
MEIKISDIIEFLKKGNYDINEKSGKIFISSKEDFYTLITIEKYRFLNLTKK